MKKYFALILFFSLLSGTAASYTRFVSSSGNSPRWLSMPVPFWINDRGSPQILNGSDFEAILASFRTWENVPSAGIRFDYRGTTPAATVGRDGMNIVSFTDNSTPLGSSTIAATFSYYRVQGSEILSDESDIVFSPSLQYSTSGEAGKFDIQSVLTHEIGHLLGLDHSGLLSSVMVPFGATGQIHQRTLTYDDIAGVSEIYPVAGAQASVGQIRGSLMNGASPVFGAQVVAVDQTGTVWLSTISQPGGSYVLRFLPPGSYKVFAEPMDLPVNEQNLGGGGTGFYRNLRTDFGTTYFGNVSNFYDAAPVQVAAGTATAADIQVLPKGMTGLNLTRPAFGVRIPRDASGTLTVGGEDVTAGTIFDASTSDVFIGSPTYGGRISTVASTSAAIPLSIGSGAVLGPKNLTVFRGIDSSVLAGALLIVDRQPAPASASPSSGPTDGGTVVTVSGSNFREGAAVYFGGLLGSDTIVLNSNTIRTATPRNAPGGANVQVINSDGTNGLIANGFAYVPPMPSITGIAPSSGPPTTAVTIDGAQFDSRAQNLDVRFNGVPARIVSATTTQINAVVPYAATSGPVTVSVFGVAAAGNFNFTVTPALPSSNRAVDTFKFVDASPASGGTEVFFQGPGAGDDGLATVTLPFTFSLFNDIYLAGSDLTVSTNGWLSLETVSDPLVFQNGPLPGTSAVDSGGTTRTIPPSLLAPFFDDLVMVSGVSSVSTRLLGSAPNRQLIVQWSKFSILDEDARDLNANITFQAVLFEGSNDIQFVFQSMTGPRSDGSSATIGIQNLARNTAVVTGFNQSKVGPGSFVTYRFDVGSYNPLQGDSTPPTQPVVVDAGALTSSSTELLASWTAQDAESGIREYQYAIGRSAGAVDVVPFTTINQPFVRVTGLSLTAGSTYYFAVRAINNMGLVGDIGLSDGIKVEPTFRPDVRIVPYSPQNSAEFSGIALYAPAAVSAVLKAYDNSGNLITGSGTQNPAIVQLAAGQQSARLINELFGVSNFDGWIEIEASSPGLGVYTATGSWNLQQMDGSTVRNTSADFVMFHPGATAILVNPSTRVATVTVTDVPKGTIKTITIAPRSKVSTTLTDVSQIRSSEPLAAIERFGSNGKLGIGSPAPTDSGQPSLVIPNGVTGLGYTTTLTLINLGSTVDATVSFDGLSRTINIAANSFARVSLSDVLQLPGSQIHTGAVRVTTSFSIFGSMPALVGVADIENSSGVVSLGARPATTDFVFGHVAHGNGLFTGLCIAAGANPASVTIEVYGAAGGTPKTATVQLGANQQIAKTLSELVPAVSTQMGGYIRIHSDQPVWAWEIYGSNEVMASGPPM